MLTFRKDTIFIGYGRTLRCSRCNNSIVQRMYQTHNSSGMFGIQYQNFYGNIFCICPTCEYGTEIKKGEVETLKPLMMAGRLLTKTYFEGLSARDKRDFIKRLDRLKQKDLIMYLG